MNKTPPSNAIREAKDYPGGWVYEIHEGFDANGEIPPFAIIGAWKVNDEGLIVGDFVKNPNFDKEKTLHWLSEKRQ